MIDFVDMTRCNLDKITQPILVIQAKNDPVTSYKCLQTLKKYGSHPASKFVLFHDGGHVLINGKRGGEVMDLCGKFVKEV
jgi:esterase/lipase